MKIDTWEGIILTSMHNNQYITTVIDSSVIMKIKFIVYLWFGLYTKIITEMMKVSLSSFWELSTPLSSIISKLLKILNKKFSFPTR